MQKSKSLSVKKGTKNKEWEQKLGNGNKEWERAMGMKIWLEKSVYYLKVVC